MLRNFTKSLSKLNFNKNKDEENQQSIKKEEDNDVKDNDSYMEEVDITYKQKTSPILIKQHKTERYSYSLSQSTANVYYDDYESAHRYNTYYETQDQDDYSELGECDQDNKGGIESREASRLNYIVPFPRVQFTEIYSRSVPNHSLEFSQSPELQNLDFNETVEALPISDTAEPDSFTEEYFLLSGYLDDHSIHGLKNPASDHEDYIEIKSKLDDYRPNQNRSKSDSEPNPSSSHSSVKPDPPPELTYETMGTFGPESISYHPSSHPLPYLYNPYYPTHYSPSYYCLPYPYPAEPYFYYYEQLEGRSVEASSRGEVEPDLIEWKQLADSHFTLDDEPKTNWEEAHANEELVEELKRNPFIPVVLSKQTSPLKIINLHKSTQYKEIQNHCFSPNVLFIRHIRYYNCAYIVYRNYHEMMKACRKYHLSAMNKHIIQCRPSTMKELQEDYEVDVVRRLQCKKRIVNKKYDTYIPDYHHQDQTYSHFLTHQLLTQEKELKIKKKYVLQKSPSHFVIIKILEKQDLIHSKEYGYLPFKWMNKIEFLNHVFNECYETILFISLKGSSKFQGCAKMKSEVLDIKDMSDDSKLSFLENTDWDYTCKIEWIKECTLPLKEVGELTNPWNFDKRIKYTNTVTLVEPNVAESIMVLMDKYLKKKD